MFTEGMATDTHCDYIFLCRNLFLEEVEWSGVEETENEGE